MCLLSHTVTQSPFTLLSPQPIRDHILETPILYYLTPFSCFVFTLRQTYISPLLECWQSSLPSAYLCSPLHYAFPKAWFWACHSPAQKPLIFFIVYQIKNKHSWPPFTFHYLILPARWDLSLHWNPLASTMPWTMPFFLCLSYATHYIDNSVSPRTVSYLPLLHLQYLAQW